MLCNAQLSHDHRDDGTLQAGPSSPAGQGPHYRCQVHSALATRQPLQRARAELARRDSSNRQQLGWCNKLWLKRNSLCSEIEVTFYILSFCMVNEINFVALVLNSDMPFITNH